MAAKRKRILCRIKPKDDSYGTHVIYRDGTFRMLDWDKGEYGTWDIAISNNNNIPLFLYRCPWDEGDKYFECEGTDESFIAVAIIKAQADLEMENLLKGK